MQQVAQQWHKTNTSAGIKKAALVAWSDNAFWYVQPDAWLPTAELKHQKTKNWRGSDEKIQACNVIASHIFLGSLLCTGQSMSSDGQSSGWISLSLLNLSFSLSLSAHMLALNSRPCKKQAEVPIYEHVVAWHHCRHKRRQSKWNAVHLWQGLNELAANEHNLTCSAWDESQYLKTGLRTAKLQTPHEYTTTFLYRLCFLYHRWHIFK